MDKRKRNLIKRILAWIYLVLFVLVLLNLMIFEFYSDIFLVVYIVLIIVYLLTFGYKKSTPQNKQDTKSDNDE